MLAASAAAAAVPDASLWMDAGPYRQEMKWGSAFCKKSGKWGGVL